MVDNKLKCKLCKKDFTEREGLEGLKCCEGCDDSGRSGVLIRSRLFNSPTGKPKSEVLYRNPEA